MAIKGWWHLALAFLLLAISPELLAAGGVTAHWQGEMAGEVTRSSVILQARMTRGGRRQRGHMMGRGGRGAFELSTHPDFTDVLRTDWMTATRAGDFILKTMVTGLSPGTVYYYRLLSGNDLDHLQTGPRGRFTTLGVEGSSDEISFVTVTGMNRFVFLHNSDVPEKHHGFPALATIASLRPSFVVATGDNVYYDTPAIGRAKTRKRMRAKWHRQFATGRFGLFFGTAPVYWQKDDHDHRYNDSDPHGNIKPTHRLGRELFLEQVPVVDPVQRSKVTYRTHRINDLLQIWLLEGRDYRDPNTKKPEPDKTMWGAEQKAWLQTTLQESDTVFKIVISPTALVGPDDNMTGGQGGWIGKFMGAKAIGQGGDKRKLDNHTNPDGFKDEADGFFAWLTANGFNDENLYIVCGDRHWQYHSIRPDGFEEFCCGALVDGNARLGPKPGDPSSTDPDGLISQPYRQDEPSGGFLRITVRAGLEAPEAIFHFHDEHGNVLAQIEKNAK